MMDERARQTMPMSKRMKKRSKRASAFEAGDRVIIVRSWHSDIPAGACGIISRPLKNGYGVDVTAGYTSGANRNEIIVETRCVFFAHEELQREPPPESVSPSNVNG